MIYENILHFLHILGWVCWLGTDLGVFMSGKFSENRDFSVDTRLAMLSLLSKLDKIPRVAVPLVFTTGILLANNYGVDFIPTKVGASIGVLWLIITTVGVTGNPSGVLAPTALKANLAIFILVGLCLGASAVWSLMGADIMPGWMAVKWLAFTWTALLSLGIDIALKPTINAYIRLKSEGANDDTNADLSKNLSRIYRIVILIYIGTIVAAYFGINKIF